MKSLLFMARKTMKNRLLQLRRKPYLLVLYAFFIFLIVFSFVSSSEVSTQVHDMGGLGFDLAGFSDIGWLKLIFLAYTLLFAVTNIQAGLSNGASFFTMADANFLFISPVNDKLVLVYGLGRQALRSLTMSVFILMMGGTLSSIFGVGPGALWALFGGYVVSLILFQMFSVCIYMYANGRPALKKVVVAVCLLALVPTLAAIGLPVLQGVPAAEALLSAMRGNILFALPVAGWVTQAVFALIAGETMTFVLAAGLTLAGAAVALALLTVGKSDYYEDVLVATETTYQRQQAVAEGNMSATDTAKAAKVKSSDKGIWGWGASAFLGKHILEDFRRNRLKIFDATSFSFIAVSLLMSFLLRGDEGNLLSIFITTMMMRIFLVGTGLGLKELYYHYIFMAPTSSFKKLVWSNVEVAVKSFAESLVAYTIAGLLLRAPVLEVVGCIVVSTLFSFLLVSINLLSMRIFTSIISQGLLITLYMLFVILVMAPGVVVAVILGSVLGGALAFPVAFLVLGVWEILLTLLFFFLSRGVLDTCDIETMPKSTRG